MILLVCSHQLACSPFLSAFQILDDLNLKERRKQGRGKSRMIQAIMAPCWSYTTELVNFEKNRTKYNFSLNKNCIFLFFPLHNAKNLRIFNLCSIDRKDNWSPILSSLKLRKIMLDILLIYHNEVLSMECLSVSPNLIGICIYE